MVCRSELAGFKRGNLMMSFTLPTRDSAELLSAAIDAALRDILVTERVGPGIHALDPAMTFGIIQAAAGAWVYIFDQGALDAADFIRVTQIAANLGIAAPQAYVPAPAIFVP